PDPRPHAGDRRARGVRRVADGTGAAGPPAASVSGKRAARAPGGDRGGQPAGAGARMLPAASGGIAAVKPYVELRARSAFSFLEGASAPEALAEAAARAGMGAMALADRAGLYGAPRFHAAMRKLGLRPIVGAEIPLEDGTRLLLLAETRAGYQNLCRLLTRMHLRSPKGEGACRLEDIEEFAPGLVCLFGQDDRPRLERLLA